MKRFIFLLLLLLIANGCAKRNVKPAEPPRAPAYTCPPTSTVPAIPIPEAPKNGESKPAETPKIPDYGLLKPSRWEEIDGLQQDDLIAAWGAWKFSCNGLRNKPQWQAACDAASSLTNPTQAQILAFLTEQFDVYQANNADNTNTGLITGYYEPMLKASRSRTGAYQHPLYRQPDDLITVDLSEIYPELKYKRLRGKLQGNKLVPYLTRAEIESAQTPLGGKELAWVSDSIDAFFLQIQGSGLLKLDNGEQIHVGYADQNGHMYNSIGRVLVERGELTADKASMQGIKQWAANNPGKLRELLNNNPSYVFFRELPGNLPGPLGALGVPISAERSVAIDPKFIPLGAPVFLSTTQPNSDKPLKRLMLAQDTGGAIKGGVRADFFWGAGDKAGQQAGAMKQKGKIWVLLPKGFFNTSAKEALNKAQ